jgi:NAD(P)-dependent dehydrogenase (short-subunit alcohol dehydrogenase family)
VPETLLANTIIRASNMTQSDKRGTQPSVQDVALIVGGGPGISSSCARLFAENGMRVAVAARNLEKAVLETLEKVHGVRRYACDASEPAAVEQLFENVVRDIGTPRLVVHNPSWRSKRFETRRSARFS